MPRVRRLALVAVLAVLGGLALAGCRSEPGVAAYVGGTRITDAQVDAMATQIRDHRPPGASKDFRAQVLTYMVQRELMAAALADRGIMPPPVSDDDLEAVAKNNGLDPQVRFVRTAVEADLYLDKAAEAYLKGLSQPPAPTEADQREAYSRLQATGQLPPFEDVRQFFTADVMGAAIARRTAVADSVKRHPVRLSPRYDGFAFTFPFVVGGVRTSLAVPIGPQATPPAKP